ncbi:hypothetical protein WDV85_09465 [Pseudokineococcus sp. 5B2Z-1]|uniref:hypothetical protein n=1 Tax=Pseudokineococcus sp. 5B2Z-1 TaxID=3132744 RepID=UPI0030A88E16
MSDRADGLMPLDVEPEGPQAAADQLTPPREDLEGERAGVGAVDWLLDDGPDIEEAVARGAEAVADTGRAAAPGAAALGEGIGGWFD